MRIGIEMRLVTLGGAGGIAQLLRGVLRAMIRRNPQHEFVCFNTVFNRGLLVAKRRWHEATAWSSVTPRLEAESAASDRNPAKRGWPDARN